MSLPDDIFKEQVLEGSALHILWDEEERLAYDHGPVALNDVSEGLEDYLWKLREDDGDFYIARQDGPLWGAEQLLFSQAGQQVQNFCLTFDQIGNPVAAFEQEGRVKTYWYDSVLGSMTVTDWCAGRTPKIRLDWRKQWLSDISDMILFYIDDTEGKVLYRLQRDRFGVVYPTDLDSTATMVLTNLGMATNNRLYLWYEDLGYIDQLEEGTGVITIERLSERFAA